jgi:TonB family protein
MIRERTYANLLIGVALSLLVHMLIVIWAPPLAMYPTALQPSPEVEVQLREWPVVSPDPSPPEPVKLEEPAPPMSTPEMAAKPSLPPNTQALQDAVLSATTPVRPERLDIQLPTRIPIPSTPDSQQDPLRLAAALREALPYEPRLSDVPTLPDLPVPERQGAEAKALPPLPTLATPTRPEPTLTGPAAVRLPSPQLASMIKGPAAERQVLFQPPLPSVSVESESEIELRFWILPNGAVGRVVPVKKSDPRLEALAINYLRHWRFTPLPSDAPPDEQWGSIPFKFRIR